MDTTPYTTKLKQFRHTLYQNLDNRADTVMKLLDAMCSAPSVNSVME